MVSASIAFDQIMSFNGSFTDHILAEKAHVLSVSFLIDSLKKHRGGVGGNIAWSLGLLGEPSMLVGSVGEDFSEYRTTLESVGVDTSGVVVVPDDYTASGFLNADMHGNQIVSFYPGAMSASRDIDISEAANAAEYAIVGAHDPEGMMRHVREVAASPARLIFDPSQQIPILTGEQLAEGIDLADVVVANDYEFSMIGRKAELSLDDIERRVDMLVVTYGENGSEIRTGGERVHIPVAPLRGMVDPTGAGDAYRSGLIKGLLMGVDLDVVGRIAAQAATYPIEHYGTQEQQYTIDAFIERFNESFPDYAGRLHANDLMATAAR